jgi:NADH-quinone oxidoreductase subunit J
MSSDFIIFIVLAIVSILAALGLLTSRNAIYAALFLIINFVTVSVLYLMLNAPFLAIVQVSVYAGAIMVLFVFVIMLLGAERLSNTDTRVGLRSQRPLAVGLGGLLMIISLYVFLTHIGQTSVATNMVAAGPLEIGLMLFKSYLLPFEAASVLLLVAMVGAVVLTRDK